MSGEESFKEIGEVFLAPKAVQLRISDSYFFISKEDIRALVGEEISKATVQLKGRMSEWEDMGHAFLENENIVVEINDVLFYLRTGDLMDLFDEERSSIPVLVERERYEECVRKMKDIE